MRLLLVLVALAASSPSAMAQELSCASGPCLRRRSKEGFFLAELQGGARLAGGLGGEVSGLLGIGGRFRSLPFFSFFLVGEFAYSAGAESGRMRSVGLDYREEWSRRDILGGLRIYFNTPIPLRFFVDVMGGGGQLSSDLYRDGLATLDSSGWEGQAVLGGGAQVRLLRNLSLGVRFKVRLTGEELDELRGMIGVSAASRMALTAGITCHF